MPEGGELRVGGRPLDAAGGPARLQIRIADTGYGIAETDLPHIFEPFYSTKPEGSGLGLAMVYRVVQEHGGEIDVRSTVRARHDLHPQSCRPPPAPCSGARLPGSAC